MEEGNQGFVSLLRFRCVGSVWTLLSYHGVWLSGLSGHSSPCAFLPMQRMRATFESWTETSKIHVQIPAPS